jgi:hypothetical protein
VGGPGETARPRQPIGPRRRGGRVGQQRRHQIRPGPDVPDRDERRSRAAGFPQRRVDGQSGDRVGQPHRVAGSVAETVVVGSEQILRSSARGDHRRLAAARRLDDGQPERPIRSPAGRPSIGGSPRDLPAGAPFSVLNSTQPTAHHLDGESPGRGARRRNEFQSCPHRMY